MMMGSCSPVPFGIEVGAIAVARILTFFPGPCRLLIELVVGMQPHRRQPLQDRVIGEAP
jgi:hypothetical protein